MKKLISMAAVLTAGAMVLAGCGTSAPSPSPDANAAAGSAADTESAAKTGLGVVTSIARSANAKAGTDGAAHADSTIAAVTVDSTGKIVKCVLDTAEPTVSFNASGAITSDKTTEQLSNREIPDAGIKNVSSIGKGWTEQADAFAAWAVGKSAADVQNLKVKQTDSESGVPDSPDLTSSVTISVSSFQDAISKAVTNAAQPDPSFPAGSKSGLGVFSDISRSTDAANGKDGAGAISNYIAWVTVDDSGKILACKLDAVEATVNFSASGAVTSDKTRQLASQQGATTDGMKAASSIGKGWKDQADAFAVWAVGKTSADVTNLKVKQVGTESGVPDSPDLTSSVTMSVSPFMNAIAKAIANAK